MNSPRFHYDLIVVGGGLSAATLIYSLIENMESDQYDGPIVNIAIFDKDGNFWTGVPYGSIAESDFFLIETLKNTNCGLFSEWMHLNLHRIDSWIGSNEHLKNWHLIHKQKLLLGEIDEIYFPRYFFGIFITELLEKIVNRNRSRVKIELITMEIIDIIKHENYFQVKSEKEAFYDTNHIVLAIGSAPKKLPFVINTVAHTSVRYICDDARCAVFDLKASLPISLQGIDSTARILIIGSGASALETIYFIATRKDIFNKIESITVISTSGMLIGGFYSSDFTITSLPPYVPLRTSSDVYISTARTLYDQGILTVMKGKAEALDVVNNQFRLKIHRNLDDQPISIMSDVVINCCGSGTLSNTSSELIQKLLSFLPVNEEGRGFRVDLHNQVIGHNNFFVLGPLLNSSFTGRQAESIRAVFHEGKVTGTYLKNILCGTLSYT